MGAISKLHSFNTPALRPSGPAALRTLSPFSSLTTPLGSTVISPMGVNGLVPLDACAFYKGLKGKAQIPTESYDLIPKYRHCMQGSHLPSIEGFFPKNLSCTPQTCKLSYTALYTGGMKQRKLSQCTLNFKIQWEPW